MLFLTADTARGKDHQVHRALEKEKRKTKSVGIFLEGSATEIP